MLRRTIGATGVVAPCLFSRNFAPIYPRSIATANPTHRYGHHSARATWHTLRPGIIDPSKTGTPGGTYPCWVVINGKQKAYVSSQRDREIDVLDISSLPTVQLRTGIPLHGQPNKMILNRIGTRLFVAQDNTDTGTIVRKPTTRSRPERLEISSDPYARSLLL